MVKALHGAGIEVILDVVYNHTAEGNHLGPMLSFRGLDNRSYYRLMPDDLRFYMDFTGTGNSLNPVHPSVLRLIMDSLRYWVLECRVDGFRFDLASALARELYDVDRLSAVLRHDPPGPGALAGEADRRALGRRAGRLPGRQLPGALGRVEREVPRLRCATSGAARATWASSRSASPAPPTCTRRTAATRSPRSTSSPPTTASRCATSSRTTRSTTRRTSRTTATAPTTTARGTSAPRARPTTRPCSRCGRGSSGTSSRRCSSRRACRCCSAATSSAGRRAATTTPGARTTRSRGSTGRRRTAELLEFARRVIALRREHPVFRRTSFLTGTAGESGLPDAWWFRPDGRRMTQRDWTSPETRTLGVFLNGREIRERTPHGEPIFGDSFLLVFNAHSEPVVFTLPTRRFGSRWHVELATGEAPARAARRARARRGRRPLPDPASARLSRCASTSPGRCSPRTSDRSWPTAPLGSGRRASTSSCHTSTGSSGSTSTAEAVFAVDAGGVESADAVLAVLDGPSVDDGTACEIGLFHGLKQRDPERKGVVGLLTDLRGERRGDFAIEPLRPRLHRGERRRRRRLARRRARDPPAAGAQD